MSSKKFKLCFSSSGVYTCVCAFKLAVYVETVEESQGSSVSGAPLLRQLWAPGTGSPDALPLAPVCSR